MRASFRATAAGVAAVILVSAWAARSPAADPVQHTGHPPSAPPPAAADTSTTFGLADLERLALQRNPTLAQAAARTDMARGKALQAGLYPNPTVGYVAEQIGVAGTAGEQQGVFVQQEIVTAGKLRLSRSKYEYEASQGDWQAEAQRLRVLNGVRIAYFEALAAQRLIEVHRELLKNAEDAYKTTQQLVNVGQANRPDLLQAEIEARRARVDLRKAEEEYRKSWERVIAVLGAPELAHARLAGRLEPDGLALDWDAALAHLLEASPELQIARLEVLRDQVGLRREQVEPIPNITVRAATGYNFESRNQTADVSIGIKLPIFDRNQGSIKQAEAELARAQAEVTRVELSLRKRLADAFARYRNALESAEDFRTTSLPRAREAFELLMESFSKRRAAWPQVLVAERTYFQFSVEYINALHDLRRAQVEICGLLLVDGLTEPPGPAPGGHRDVSPRPR